METSSNWITLTTKRTASSSNFTSFTHTNGYCDSSSFSLAMNGDSGMTSATSTVKESTQSAVQPASSKIKLSPAEVYQFPPLPWDKEEQLKVASTYPGVLPKLPWDKVEQEMIVTYHELSLASSQQASSLSEAGSGCAIRGFYFVSSYTEDPDNDGIPNGLELVMGYNPLVADTNGDGTDDGLTDFDGDGLSNLNEVLSGTDPTVQDNDTFEYLVDGMVVEGEQTISFKPNPNLNTLFEDVLLFANGNTANGIAVDLPNPGELRIRWHSIFVQPLEEPVGAPPAGVANFQFTQEDRQLIREAFGELGVTSTGNGVVIEANMDAVNRMRRELLEHLTEVAANQIPRMFKEIQELNLGTRDPGPNGLERALQIRLDNIHTQYVRGGAANSSLWLRFGVALNRILPIVGGIVILANAEGYAQRLDDAARDYANDIASGSEESGSAAIMAGLCNELAPGSQNLVLDFLLR